jgi:cytochrome c oxidase subunit 3
VTETILDHGYLPEEHAPDPVFSHGDPTPPGKIGIWLFLASEIMFFVAILGTYVILRAGSPELFAKHAAALSKVLAGINTLVLLFSSFTMARAVDAAQKQDHRQVTRFLSLTILCAFAFLGIKTIEYSDKAHHETIVARGDDAVTVKYSGSGPLYFVMTTTDGQIFNGSGFEHRTAANWAKYALPLKPASPGEFTGTIPAGAAGNTVVVYEQGSAEPARSDKRLRLGDGAVTAGAGLFLYDGHVKNSGEGTLTLRGYRMPMTDALDARGGFDIHLVSEEDVKAGAKRAGEPSGEQEYRIEESNIGSSIVYGPWKNIFYASYFTLTGIHGLHVIAGIIPLAILLVQALRGKLFPAHTEYVGLYWHFVDLVWIFLFPLLYLI